MLARGFFYYIKNKQFYCNEIKDKNCILLEKILSTIELMDIGLMKRSEER